MIRRTTLLLVCFLACLRFSAQKLAHYEYWFDQDTSTTIGDLNGLTSQQLALSLDTKGMPSGLHTFYYRVQDSNGNWSPLATWVFLVREFPPNATVKVTRGEYWIDDNYEQRSEADIVSNQMALTYDASKLTEGLHTFNYRVQDNNDNWSPLSTWVFYVRELPKNGTVKATKGEYWIDDNYEQRSAVDIVSNQMALTYDASKLREGLHTFNYRVQNSEGDYSAVFTSSFMRIALRDTIVNAPQCCEYWLDDDVEHPVSVAMSGTTATFSVDASTVPEGLHTLNYRVQDKKGNYTPAHSWMFYRAALRDTTIVNKPEVCEYWFDDNLDDVQSVAVSGTEISFAADSSALPKGNHTIGIRVRDALGNYSAPQTWVFMQNAQMRASRVASYQYWWNNHVVKAETVEVTETGKSFSLVRQVEVPMYAKTDGFSRNSTARFNIVFFDDLGNASPLETAIVSYPDEIAPTTTSTITSETTESVSLKWTTNEDEIKHYNVYVAENSGPFALWLPNTTNTTASFKKQQGKTYRFLVTACDKAGNQEVYDESKCVTTKD